MKTVKKINTNNELLSISNDASKYKSKSPIGVTGQLNTWSNNNNSVIVSANTSTLKGNPNLINGTKFVATKAGKWIIDITGTSHSSAATSYTRSIGITHYSADAVIKTYSNSRTQTDSSTVWWMPINNIFLMEIGDYLTVEYNISANVTTTVTAGSRYGWFNFYLIENLVPDVYATAFAMGKPDKSKLASATNLWTSSNFNTGVSMPDSGWAFVSMDTEYSTSDNTCTVYVNGNIWKNFNIINSSSHRTILTTWIPVDKDDILVISKWQPSTSCKFIPDKTIQIIKPKVIAIQGELDSLSEQQIGWKELTQNVWVAKYRKTLSGSTVFTSNTYTDIPHGIVNMSRLLNFKLSIKTTSSSDFQILPATSSAFSNQANTGISGGNIHTWIGSAWTTTTYLYDATIEYTKTGDPTYTLEDIEAMEPVA